MPSVLIAGCGYVGTATAKLFAKARWKVIGWRLSSRQAVDKTSIDAVDLGDSESVRRARFNADVVVHCAGVPRRDSESYNRVYLEGVSNLAEHFSGARLIFTSSTSVYAQTDDSCVDERSSTEPQSETGRILLQAEQVARAHGGIVLRLGGIYGPGRSFLLRSVLDGRPPAGPDRFVNQIHRDDAARAIFFLGTHETSGRGETFNVVDDAPVLRSEILTWLWQQLSLASRPMPSPEQPVMRAKSNKRVSNAKLRQLGWVPHYRDYREAFSESIFQSFNVSPSIPFAPKT
jgi:Nucleoside-diphosphate-sugar epimerases